MTTIDLQKMLPLYGNWKATSGTILKFSSDGSLDGSHGLALLPNALEDGVVECDIQLPEAHDSSGPRATA